MRVFAPGFGAGAVAGYSVLRVDPAVVAVQTPTAPRGEAAEMPAATGGERASASEEVREAFG